MANTILIKKAYVKKIRQGYPWVFLDYVTTPSVVATAKAGELITLLDHQTNLLGTGYIDPQSKICIRMISTHKIKAIDSDFFTTRIQKALLKRKSIRENFYRLINSEGDYLPGLIIDRLDNVFSCQITTAGMLAFKDLIIETLNNLFKPSSIIIRSLDNKTPEIIGKLVDEVIVKENAVNFCTNLIEGQKTGWYFDQRENRHLISTFCKDKDVLDVYCYNGGFGINAAVHGAKSITFIDSSKGALAMAHKSLNLNTHPKAITFTQGDAFNALHGLKTQSFDIVILDPPPFIPAKTHKQSGLKGYYKLALLSIPLVRLQGLLFFASCSHHISGKELQQLTLKAIKELGRTCTVIKTMGHALDHPVHPQLPESQYLNAILLKLTS